MRGIGWAYGAIWLAAVTLGTARQLGWSPAWALVWDDIADFVLRMAMLAVMLAAALGLTLQADPWRWPRLLRWAPILAPFLVSAFLPFGILQISPGSTPDEIALDLGRTLLIALCLSMVMGLLFFSGPGRPPRLLIVRSWAQERALLILIAIFAAVPVALMVVPRPPNDGKTTPIAVFRSRSGSLKVLTRAAALSADRYGIVAVSDAEQSHVVALGPDKWDELETLWAKATKTRKAELAYIGEMYGPGGSPQLQLSAGTSGARFRIAYGRRSVSTYTLPAAEYGRYGTALHRVHEWLRH